MKLRIAWPAVLALLFSTAAAAQNNYQFVTPGYLKYLFKSDPDGIVGDCAGAEPPQIGSTATMCFTIAAPGGRRVPGTVSVTAPPSVQGTQLSVNGNIQLGPATFTVTTAGFSGFDSIQISNT